MSAVLVDAFGLTVAGPGAQTDRDLAHIDRLVTDLRPLFEEILLVTSRVGALTGIDVELVGVIHPDRGLVDAIYSGLFHITHGAAFIGSCVMPLVDPVLINYMMRRLEKYDVVVPATDRGWHPLYAVYSDRCIHRIEAQVRDNRLGVEALLQRCRILELRADEIDAHSAIGVRDLFPEQPPVEAAT